MSEIRKPTLIESMACGGVSACFAVNFTHPIELVKTRMQVTGGSIGATCGGVMANEGALAFWKGLPFAWGRELSYTSVKLGACKWTEISFSIILLFVIILLFISWVNLELTTRWNFPLRFKNNSLSQIFLFRRNVI